MNRSDFVYSFQNNVNLYNQLITSLHSDDPGLLIKETQEIDNQINEDINEMQIIVQNLDPNDEKYTEILKLVTTNLSFLAGKLNSLAIILEDASNNKDISNDDRGNIKAKFKKVNETNELVQIKYVNTSNKIKQVMEEFKFVKKESELGGKGLKEAASLTIQPQEPSFIDGVFSFFSEAFTSKPQIMIYGAGEKPIPLSFCIEEIHVDSEKGMEEVVSMMQKKEYGILVYFKNEDHIIFDKDNNAFAAPVVFVTDILRSGNFTLNGKELIKTIYHVDSNKGEAWRDTEAIPKTMEGNPNDITREMYSLFGVKGGSRLLQLCSQGICPHLQHIIQPKTEPDGEYAMAIPERILAPANETCMSFNIELDKNNLVTVTIKYMMRLHTKYVEYSDFTAHIPVKIKVTIPFKQLISDDFDLKTGKELDIHVEDTISKLIVNDRELAVEILEKL